jgi:hypothetical protein
VTGGAPHNRSPLIDERTLPEGMEMTSAAEALVEHYQKTYELTYALWQQRRYCQVGRARGNGRNMMWLTLQPLPTSWGRFGR